MPWSYFKNFLEGGSVKVSKPKNRGGNSVWKGTAPVFLTAPAEVKLFRKGYEVEAETKQMRKRIQYFFLAAQIPEHLVVEVLNHCGHCFARLYVEGKLSPAQFQQQAALAQQQALLAQPQPSQPSLAQPQFSAAEPAPKKRRTATECVEELKNLQGLLQAGLLSQEEFQGLKQRLLSGD